MQLMWCAGALCVEHEAVAPHIRKMSGGQDSVFGLPKHVVASLMQTVGYTNKKQDAEPSD